MVDFKVPLLSCQLDGNPSHLVVAANYRGLSADLLRHNSLLLSSCAVGRRLRYCRLLNLQHNTSMFHLSIL